MKKTTVEKVRLLHSFYAFSIRWYPLVRLLEIDIWHTRFAIWLRR